MQRAVIKAEHISKQYRLGKIGTGTVSHDLNRWWHRVRGKEDPYLKLGDVNDRSNKGSSDYVWSLRDVNFEINQGDAVGIIGRNGAGKSTLLKLLSRVTMPTTGKIYTKGRIASLLEVGTGFHPEMTGRENIYLNGAILGMRKHEIKRKFDEIVAFSGVERYIDTPVKRYSSGMYVRLAFAVAAHLESEILIVDEVLAVGDAEFQKSCLGKMGDVSRGEGRTVLFVSHNMAAVKTLCNRGLVLEHGMVKYTGDATSSVGYYMQGSSETNLVKHFNDEYHNDYFQLHQLEVRNVEGTQDDIIDEYKAIQLVVTITVKKEAANKKITFVMNNEEGITLFTFSHANFRHQQPLHEGLNEVSCTIPAGFLNIGSYYLSMYYIENSKTTLFVEKDIMAIHVQQGERKLGGFMGKEPGFVKPIFDWVIR
ncbi:MAG: ATP-binding cassette domain-containing protein [Chitinophagaceae bacterium]|nr:ATP-binding cassette domain-containing protein [Chitinophagaceae bacterium]